MPATPVKIGPFAGGLNSYSGPTSIADNEVSDILNFDIDFDGSLYSRAPITVKEQATVPGATGELMLLGWFIDTDGTRFLITSYDSRTYARNEETGTWIAIASTFGATCMVQYAGKAYLIAHPSSANPGGWWSPTGGWNAVPALPKGTSACIYKERLFIAGSTTNPNRVFFSNPADFLTYQTTINFFDVRAGDGQEVVALLTLQDTIAVFKETSTYVYSYDSNPSRGAVRLINGAVGLTNKHCIVEYENSLYIHFNDTIYQISNWNFTVVNLKVPLRASGAGASGTNYPSLSVMADRLVVYHFDAIYVFSLKIGAWTKWGIASDTRRFNRFIEVPRSSPEQPRRYYAGNRSGDAALRGLLEWMPDLDGGRSESMTCYIMTKTFDFNVPYSFKRLFWWGVDMLSKSDISFSIHPVVYSPGVTHAQMAQFTHEQITGNHLRPLIVSIDVTSYKSISNGPGDRLFVKLLRSLRFRQVFFSLSSIIDGTPLQSPLRVYSVVAFIDNKQVASKELS